MGTSSFSLSCIEYLKGGEGVEREFSLWVLEEKLGGLSLTWDELRMTALATLDWRQEGLWKVTLVGEGGQFLLGTLVPDGGRLLLRRTLSLSEVRRGGAWPPVGAVLSLRCVYREDQPFPLPKIFCFAKPEEEGLRFEFDFQGRPRMLV